MATKKSASKKTLKAKPTMVSSHDNKVVSKSSANVFWGKIDSEKNALNVVKQAAIVLYIVGGLNLLGALLLIVGGAFSVGIAAIIDGAVYAVLGILLQKLNSRAVAIIVTVIAIVGLLFTAYNLFSGTFGAKNVIIAIVILIAGIRSIQATYLLNASKKAK